MNRRLPACLRLLTEIVPACTARMVRTRTGSSLLPPLSQFALDATWGRLYASDPTDKDVRVKTAKVKSFDRWLPQREVGKQL